MIIILLLYLFIYLFSTLEYCNVKFQQAFGLHVAPHQTVITSGFVTRCFVFYKVYVILLDDMRRMEMILVYCYTLEMCLVVLSAV
jgi:hypothetical protein